MPTLINGTLLTFGAIAMASPIIIHLLNKRKFKTVDWAAMDFLLEADKKNRRRVRLENLILLLLRCLACLLIGLMLARPISELVAGMNLMTQAEYERVVLLDDSLSMGVGPNNETSFDKSKASLISFVQGLTDNGSKDHFTLHLTSNPAVPEFNKTLINDQTAGEIAQRLEELQPADRTASLEESIAAVKQAMASKDSKGPQPVVYVVSDMRKRDWPLAEAAGDAKETDGQIAMLREIAGGQQGKSVFLVDVGADDDLGNVLITRVSSKEKSLVAGVQSEFEIAVRNTGSSDIKDVTLRFAQVGAVPYEIEIPSLPAGETEVKSIPFTFAAIDDPIQDKLEPVQLTATVVPPGEVARDELSVDNQRFFAARVTPGVKTLVVDGDPNDIGEKSESFFLRRGLAPRRGRKSGVALTVISDDDFNLDAEESDGAHLLDEYQVIFLCNVYHISDERLEQLEEWVAAGGGLVISLGNLVDAEEYNRKLYKDGKGLMPVMLDSKVGDEEEESWVQLNPQTANHPVLEVYKEAGRLLIETVKVFQWYTCEIDEQALKNGTINIPTRLTDEAQTPAMVEKKVGQGRVFLITTSLDDGWNDWPQEGIGYVFTVQDLTKYMARKTADEANLAVGERIHHTLDLTEFEQDTSLRRPDKEELPLTANAADEEGESSGGSQVLYEVDYADVNQRGFYQLKLNPRDGDDIEQVLFAANIDPAEGELARADTKELMRRFGDADVTLVNDKALINLGGNRSKGEWWKWVLGALLGVLCLEQFLGWYFGRRR